MGEDEASTAKAVREHREAASPIIASLSGRLVETMGEGLLLLAYIDEAEARGLAGCTPVSLGTLSTIFPGL